MSAADRPLEEQLRPMMRALAKQYSGPRLSADDIEQELRIELWQFQQKRPPRDDDSNYVGLCATRLRGRALDYFRHGLATGMPRQQRGTVDPIRHGVDVPMDYAEHDRPVTDEDVFTPEVAAAVRALPERDRRIVWERAIEGKTWPEIAKCPDIDLTVGGLSNRWSVAIKPRLTAALAHLAD